jgi:spore maturation protein CgeB
VKLHETLAFRSKAGFVPLATSRGPQATNVPIERTSALTFVGAPTPNRRDLLAQVKEPVALFGPGWQHATELSHHRRDARRIGPQELASIYASHMGVLNIRHGTHVINGLNHRHFAPYIQGTAVITDSQSDVQFCFDEGTEILIYRDANELNELYSALRRDPTRLAAIGLAGQRRVLASHAYAHRLESIARLAGVIPTGGNTSRCVRYSVQRVHDNFTS